MIRVARDSDFGARVQQGLERLQAQLGEQDAALEAFRAANATLQPHKVAQWIVDQANLWLPAPCWAIVAHSLEGQIALLAEVGLTPTVGPSMWGAAGWVMEHGREFVSADAATDDRLSGQVGGTIVAVPLACRGRTIAALVGVDPVASSTAPAVTARIQPIRRLLEPPAVALDNALTVERAEALSVTDDLTRLYNTRYLNQVLRRETKRAMRSGRPLSLLFIDLDGFKGINDSHGHLAGSRALVEVAAIVKGSARETDIAARFGGDEFSVILPDTGRDGAVAVGERVRERIRDFVFLSAEGLTVRLTASVGVATLPDAAVSAEELLRAADMAMYRVKSSGKNGIHVAQAQDEGASSPSS